MNAGGALSPFLCEPVPARTLLPGAGPFGEQGSLGAMLVREKVENLSFSCHWVPSGIKDRSAWPKAGYVFTMGLLFKGSKIAPNKKNSFLLLTSAKLLDLSFSMVHTQHTFLTNVS